MQWNRVPPSSMHLMQQSGILGESGAIWLVWCKSEEPFILKKPTSCTYSLSSGQRTCPLLYTPLHHAGRWEREFSLVMIAPLSKRRHFLSAFGCITLLFPCGGLVRAFVWWACCRDEGMMPVKASGSRLLPAVSSPKRTSHGPAATSRPASRYGITFGAQILPPRLYYEVKHPTISRPPRDSPICWHPVTAAQVTVWLFFLPSDG